MSDYPACECKNGETCQPCTDYYFQVVLPENGYVVLDSGDRTEFASGMVRDIATDKPDYTLVDLDMLERWAWQMTRGAQKYGRENWRLADGQDELTHFKASAFRHLINWLREEPTEDHAAAIFFNVAAAEFVKRKINEA